MNVEGQNRGFLGLMVGALAHPTGVYTVNPPGKPTGMSDPGARTALIFMWWACVFPGAYSHVRGIQKVQLVLDMQYAQ